MSRQEKLAALASTGVTKAELDNIDGGTARGTTAIADGDGVLINDAGTMRMTSVQTVKTYMTEGVGASTTTGAVGTYAMLYENTLNAAVRGPGDDLAASSTLYYCSTKGTGDPGAVLTRNTAPSGTWRLMGDSSTHYTENDKPISVWLRIS